MLCAIKECLQKYRNLYTTMVEVGAHKQPKIYLQRVGRGETLNTMGKPGWNEKDSEIQRTMLRIRLIDYLL